jgi:hypothetical protein
VYFRVQTITLVLFYSLLLIALKIYQNLGLRRPQEIAYHGTCSGKLPVKYTDLISRRYQNSGNTLPHAVSDYLPLIVTCAYHAVMGWRTVWGSKKQIMEPLRSMGWSNKRYGFQQGRRSRLYGIFIPRSALSVIISCVYGVH